MEVQGVCLQRQQMARMVDNAVQNVLGHRSLSDKVNVNMKADTGQADDKINLGDVNYALGNFGSFYNIAYDVQRNNGVVFSAPQIRESLKSLQNQMSGSDEGTDFDVQGFTGQTCR